MDLAAFYVAQANGLVEMLGISHATMHVHAGMALYVGAKFMLRTRRASAYALLTVIHAELANELLDFLHYGSLRLEDTLADIALTLLWPVLDYGVTRYRRKRWRGESALRRPAPSDATDLLASLRRAA
ncbi:hypothetical protein SAMIE_1032370 [Sphingobium amiense]|uniref:DUF2809 domain-containing protein n=1 Tax=Sphingobium amiense TaxID=135719 RepID=A0A494W8S6_9SPHN|nr:hypothetical protein [Sphingobium amiense]BBD99736.1 hypothetical protein SAMIE_1032370 [Sphingobium amiense]